MSRFAHRCTASRTLPRTRRTVATVEASKPEEIAGSFHDVDSAESPQPAAKRSKANMDHKKATNGRATLRSPGSAKPDVTMLAPIQRSHDARSPYVDPNRFRRSAGLGRAERRSHPSTRAPRSIGPAEQHDTPNPRTSKGRPSDPRRKRRGPLRYWRAPGGTHPRRERRRLTSDRRRISHQASNERRRVLVKLCGLPTRTLDTVPSRDRSPRFPRQRRTCQAAMRPGAKPVGSPLDHLWRCRLPPMTTAAPLCAHLHSGLAPRLGHRGWRRPFAARRRGAGAPPREG